MDWPLKPLSASYNNIVREDIVINSGRGLINWNPFSHNGYWRDDDFVTDLCKEINKLLSN